MNPVVAIGLGLLLLLAWGAWTANLVPGGDFEGATPPSFTFWSRDGTGSAEVVAAEEHGQVASIAHPGEQDWSLPFLDGFDVQPLQVYRMACDVKLAATPPEGKTWFSLIGYPEDETASPNWNYAPLVPDPSTTDWQHLEGRFIVSPGIAKMTLRLMGEGPAELQVDNIELELVGSLLVGAAASTQRNVTLRNNVLSVTLNPRNWSFIATDRRNGLRWQTFPCEQVVVLAASQVSDLEATFGAVVISDGSYERRLECVLTVRLDAEEPELAITTTADPALPVTRFVSTCPALAASGEGCELIVPMNEGRLYSCADRDIQPAWPQVLYSGHGLCMPWTGIADPKSGAAALWWTREADDAAMWLRYKEQGELASATGELLWQAQKGLWGYDRTVHYWFAEEGGYVGLCKRYRREAEEAGKLVTLAQKRVKLPAVERLIGAANTWLMAWDMKPEERIAALEWFKEQGVERLLHSNAVAPEEIEAAKSLGYLTSIYDIYQDVWDPADLEKAKLENRTQGWPDDIIMREDGTLMHGWVIRTEQGPVPGYVACGTQHKKWAEVNIPPDKVAYPREARFIDTTTAAALYECYNPLHPCSRTGEKDGKYALLDYVGQQGLVCGSETGIDWAIPVVSFFEGMMSLGPYRHPEAGYLQAGPEPNEETVRYQLNPGIRLPLFELVYHDCVVDYWYWGDCSNTFPSLWKQRDLFNALYATPPMFMVLKRATWEEQRNRMVETCKFLEPVFDAVEDAEMISHQFCSDDRQMQLTEFSNGVGVLVNFSESARSWKGFSVKPKSYRLLLRGE